MSSFSPAQFSAPSSYLIGKLDGKISILNIGLEVEFFTGEYFAGRRVIEKIINVGPLPDATTRKINTGINDAYYFWLDPGFSCAFNSAACYPIPYTDPSNNKNAISVRLNTSGEKFDVQTAADWSGYSAYVAIKYTKR